MGMTIRDIAREAGVSTATVSRALRGLPNVDSATRDRVRAVAERLDYVASPAASQLASGRSGGVGVITPFVARWYFANVLSGVERVLQRSDLDLVLFAVGDSDEPHRVPPARRLRRRVEGFLVIALDPDSPDVREVRALDMPVTLIGAHHERTNSVAIDDVSGGRIATQHLINQGHKRIALISGRQLPSPFSPEWDRSRGFTEAMEQAGLVVDPDLIAPGCFTVDGGEAAMAALLAVPEPPTAVFAISDEMAFGAVRALRRQRLQPGTDVAIVGFDGHELSDLLDITTVSQPVVQLGALAAEALLEVLSHPHTATRQIQLPTQLMVRGSSIAARR